MLRKILFLFTIIFFGGIVIWVIVHNYVNKQKESQIYLDNIFCQHLHRGMSIEEVKTILNEYGEYEEYQYDYPGRTQIIIHFTSKDIIEIVGEINIYLNFFDEVGYIGPELLYGADSKDICINGLSE